MRHVSHKDVAPLELKIRVAEYLTPQYAGGDSDYAIA
jgi:hypothetical protein